MKRFSVICFWIGALAIFNANNASADILFESGTLGPTGVPWDDLVAQTVLGANINPNVFNGVRFRLAQPAVVTQIGGHFVAPTSSAFFGALVALDDENDFPNSSDLSTPDVLGTVILAFPTPSSEVFGELNVLLDPGWYALVFGSGLFSATGSGGALLNNPDIGNPTYIGFQGGAVSGWGNLSNPIFRNYRFVVNGQVVPEPAVVSLLAVTLVVTVYFRRSKR